MVLLQRHRLVRFSLAATHVQSLADELEHDAAGATCGNSALLGLYMQIFDQMFGSSEESSKDLQARQRPFHQLTQHKHTAAHVYTASHFVKLVVGQIQEEL